MDILFIVALSIGIISLIITASCAIVATRFLYIMIVTIDDKELRKVDDCIAGMSLHEFLFKSVK